MKQFEMLEHTGDIKIRVFGKDQKELFMNAAQAMMSFLYGEKKYQCDSPEIQPIELLTSDQESLLVDWLSELLYLSDTKKKTSVKFNIKEITTTHIKAEVHLCSAEQQDDIKAVTYNQLEIKQRNDHWEAVVVFDI